MDYKFEIGGGEVRTYSEIHRCHFSDWPDSIGLRMTKKQAFDLMARLARRLVENADKGNNEMMPTLSYVGKIEEDKW